MSFDLHTLKRGMLVFWAGWFTLVVATNACDGLKAVGLLGSDWAFASGNFGFLASVTAKYGTPAGINALLFASVILWEATAAVLFWRASWRHHRDAPANLAPVDAAFTVSLPLWAAFLLADEFFVAYEVAGSHWRIFIAQLATLLSMHLLPTDRTGRAGGEQVGPQHQE